MNDKSHTPADNKPESESSPAPTQADLFDLDQLGNTLPKPSLKASIQTLMLTHNCIHHTDEIREPYSPYH